MMNKSYSDLRELYTFEDRLSYLKLEGDVGISTFGFDRWVNQRFYKSQEWKTVRRFVVLRDECCDLGIPGYEIYGTPLIHHINPMSLEDIVHGEAWIIDPEYLITTTKRTHNMIHFGDDRGVPDVVVSRKPNDTKLWRS